MCASTEMGEDTFHGCLAAYFPGEELHLEALAEGYCPVCENKLHTVRKTEIGLPGRYVILQPIDQEEDTEWVGLCAFHGVWVQIGDFIGHIHTGCMSLDYNQATTQQQLVKKVLTSSI